MRSMIRIIGKRYKKSEWQNKKKRTGLPLKEKVSSIFELPEEILLNTPRIFITGNNKLLVENCKGIMEYSRERIRLNTSGNLLVINGTALDIKEITLEDILIKGNIESLEFK